MTSRAFALVLTFAIALGVIAVQPAGPAAAAVTGAGYHGITPYGGYLGNYVAPDGYRVYCMDSSRDWPSGATGGGSLVGELVTTGGTVVSGAALRKINYVLAKYGQTDDPTQAAGVSAFIYSYTSTRASNLGAGYAVGSHYIDGNAAVQAAFGAIWNDAEANGVAAAPRASIDITMTTAYDGFVDISASPGLGGTLTLEGAVVAGTTDSTAHVDSAARIPIHGVPTAGQTQYDVAGSVRFSGISAAEPNVVIYYTGGQQRTLRAGGSTPLTVDARDSVTLSLQFSPVAHTQVAAQFVQRGDAFVDGVNSGVAQGSQPWPSGLSVTATGTLYGPFSEQPDVASAAPANAPVVGTEQVELTGEGSFRSPGTLRATTAGFYVWVWKIDAAAQPEPVRALLPDDYVFADDFGLVAETHVVAAAVSAVTQASINQTGFGGTIGDELAISVESGAWLSVDGSPVAATFEGTAYFVPGDGALVETDSVPDFAEVLGTARLTVTSPGIYESPATVVAPIAVGWVTWVWKLTANEYFVPWSDRFGLVAETTRVAAPTVVTRAMPAAPIGDPVHDTAVVSGTLPAETSTLVFEAYLQPGPNDAVCDATTLVFTSGAVDVVAVGEFDSPTTTFDVYGTYLWVESLYAADGTLIHRGECGAADETTLVTPGNVVTSAVPAALVGDAVHDVAVVSGLVPQGATLGFGVYLQLDGEGPLCEPGNLVASLPPMPVAGAGEYRSADIRLELPGRYFWVETLYDRAGAPLHVGECGAQDETTAVTAVALGDTGVSVIQRLVVAGGLFGIGSILFMVAFARRRANGNIR